MNKTSIFIQTILFIAVLILYILHFSEKKTEIQSEGVTVEANGAMLSPAGSGRIVFINSDSLLDNYVYFKDQKVEFESRQNKIRNELESESSKLQRDVESYQQRSVGMTDMQRQIEEEQLMMRQQKLMQRKDELLEKLDEEQARSSEELFTRLSDFLKKYNEGKNFQYILGFQKGGGILFANDSLDITGPVLQGLNKEYEDQRK